MSNTVNKPITVAANDLLNDLVNLINSSGLPYFIIENILKDCYNEVHMASQQQIKADRERYKLALKAEQEETEYEVS